MKVKLIINFLRLIGYKPEKPRYSEKIVASSGTFQVFVYADGSGCVLDYSKTRGYASKFTQTLKYTLRAAYRAVMNDGIKGANYKPVPF